MTDKVKMYAVKNDEGEYWDFELEEWSIEPNGDYTCDKDSAKITVNRSGGHVVELVEAPAKEVVNEKEASLLEKMADGTNFNGERGFEPGLVITNFVLNNPVHGESHFDTEDRLMRAYVNGWTVEKPKRYVLPMPDGFVGESQRAMRIAIRDKDEGWYGSTYHYDVTASETPSYTQADLNNAPGWVKAITPVEVTDDDAKK